MVFFDGWYGLIWWGIYVWVEFFFCLGWIGYWGGDYSGYWLGGKIVIGEYWFFVFYGMDLVCVDLNFVSFELEVLWVILLVFWLGFVV